MDSDQVFAALAQWGSRFSPDMIQGTLGLYAPLVPRPDEARTVRHEAYGPHERNRIDIFRPADDAPAPCVLFVHGGGFVMGDKGAPDAPFHNNVGAWATVQGYVGATMTYRLAPEASWPDGRDDVIAAICWLFDHSKEFGIDPGRLFIMGTSAGATHVADVVANPGAAKGKIAGAMMISGIYDLALAEYDEFKPAYYGKDQADWHKASSVHGLIASDIPCFFTVSELDPPDFQMQAAALVSAWVAERQHWPRMHQLSGHNHLSSCSQLGTDHDALGPLAVKFLESI